MIIPVVAGLAGLAGLILGLIISKILEKSKANKILSATKKESNSLIKQAKVEAEALKKDKILQAKEKFIELKSEHEKVILNREKKISEVEKRTREKESQIQSQMDKTKRLNTSLEHKEKDLNHILEHLDKKEDEVSKLHMRHVDLLEQISGFSADEAKKELVKIVHLLDELNKDKYTKNILRHLANDNIKGGSEILAAELATNISRYDFAIQVSKIASYQKRFHNNFNYPIISTPEYVNGRKIPETAFILSLIRQESEFDMRANSHVGAQGLMQLMPYTAKLVAKQAKLPYSKSRLTSDPEYNINLGSHYIAGLILQYDGAYPFATAAYNAGPKRVKHWKKINKDPQKKQIDFVDWVELIPFKETRNYVQRVMENYNVYRYILEKKPIKMKDFFKDQPLF